MRKCGPKYLLLYSGREEYNERSQNRACVGANKVYIIIYSHDKAVQNGGDFHALMIGAGFVSFIITVLRSWCVESYPFHSPVFVQAPWTMKPEYVADRLAV